MCQLTLSASHHTSLEANQDSDLLSNDFQALAGQISQALFEPTRLSIAQFNGAEDAVELDTRGAALGCSLNNLNDLNAIKLTMSIGMYTI
jgi:hypothetical protein